MEIESFVYLNIKCLGKTVIAGEIQFEVSDLYFFSFFSIGNVCFSDLIKMKRLVGPPQSFKFIPVSAPQPAVNFCKFGPTEPG